MEFSITTLIAITVILIVVVIGVVLIGLWAAGGSSAIDGAFKWLGTLFGLK